MPWSFLGLQALHMALRTPVQATNSHAGTINTAFHSQGHQRCHATHQLCRLQYLEPQEAPTFLRPLSP